MENRYLNCDKCPDFKDTQETMLKNLIAAGFPDMVELIVQGRVGRRCAYCTLNDRFTCPALTIPELRQRGVRYFEDDGGSGVYYWIFKRNTRDETIKEYLASVNIEFDGVHIDSAYDCSGRFCSRQVNILRQGSRVLVTQHWGIDV